MAEVIKTPLRFEDLLNEGTHFEIDANREDFDTEMFDVCDDEIEEINDEEIEKSPWQMDFDDLRKKMIPLNNFIYKKIVKEGHTEIPPNSSVTIDYNAYFEHEEQSYDSTYMRGKPQKIRLGFGEVLQGLEDAVKSMKKGEESQFIISYHALYGENGCPPRIKPKADVLFIIRCKDFKELMPGSNTMDPEKDTNFTVNYKKAIILESDAKSAFRKGDYLLAITRYKRAVEALQFAQLKDETEEKSQTDLLKKLFLNLSVCYNKQQQPKKACLMINNLRDLNGVKDNPKALFQEGKALRMIGDYERARKSLLRAAQLKPDDESIASEIRFLEDKVQKAKEEEKQMCQRAFGVVATTIAKTACEKDKTDDATTEVFKKRIQEFLDGDVPTLSLPGPLDPNIVKCIKDLETVMKFKLDINATESTTYYKLKKI